MITASHNPANFNGYKVYNDEGCQVTDDAANEILECIRGLDMFSDVITADFDLGDFNETTFLNEKAHEYIETIPSHVIDNYIGAVKNTGTGINCKDLEVVYTPLNGAGNKPVRRILEEIGIEKIHIVPEQEKPDGNFPTCPYPNPEKEEALFKGLALCQELETPDLLLATDPDCDRLGVAVRHIDLGQNKLVYKRLSGNEIGVILLDFICSKRNLPENAVAMKTIVSTNMADAVARHYGVDMINLLTGFKYIGEQIGIMEQKGEEDRFIFGFEESFGYLSGSYVRDKDAVNAAMLICEAAAYYKKIGKTLIDRMEELYNIHGWFLNDLMEFTFEGVAGMLKMHEILSNLRQNPPKEVMGLAVKNQTDYKAGKRYSYGDSCDMSAGYRPTGLPEADVLEYSLEDGSNIIIRPSGTEPKLKIYLSSKGEDETSSKNTIIELQKKVREWIV